MKQRRDVFASNRVTPGQALRAKRPDEWVRRELDKIEDAARRADQFESLLDLQLSRFQPFTKGWWDTLKEINRVRSERIAMGEGAIAGPLQYSIGRESQEQHA